MATQRRSLFGPVLLILIGILLLLSNLWPELSFFQLFSFYWPWILIFWGAFRLLEHAVAALRGVWLQPMGAGSALLAALLAAVGSFTHAWETGTLRWPDWPQRVIRWVGQEYTFPLVTLRRVPDPATEAVIIRDLPGRIRVVGTKAKEAVVGGRKKVRAVDREKAYRRADLAELAFTEEGASLVIQTALGRQRAQDSQVFFDVEIAIPKRLPLRVESVRADTHIEGFANGVSIDAPVQSVALSNIEGPVHVQGSRARRLEGERLSGPLVVEGSARRIELSDVTGSVDIEGKFFPFMSLERIRGPLTFESEYGEIQVSQLPGSVKLRSRSLAIKQAQGPVEVSASRLRNVRLERISGEIAVRGERTDVDLRLNTRHLADLQVDVKKGNIEAILRADSPFSLIAETERGEATHDFGSAFQAEIKGESAILTGQTGPGGPRLRLATEHGDIQLKRREPRKPRRKRL